MTSLRFVFAILSALLLSACGGPTGQDYALACIFEIDPPGGYGYPAGVLVPTVVPEAGGTQAGADALNACIIEKSGGVASQSTPSLGGTNSVQLNGNSTVRTFTYGTPRDSYGNPIQPPMSTPAQPASQVGAAQPGTGICNLRMTGGSAYTCQALASRRN